MRHVANWGSWTFLAATLMAAGSACSNETTDFANGGISITADVDGSSLERAKSYSEFRITFGTVGKTGGKDLWSNGITLLCNSRENTIFVSGAGSFKVDLNEFDKSDSAKITLATDAHQIGNLTRRSIVTHTDGFSVWSGVAPDGMRELVKALGNGEAVYFMIDEPKTPLKTVTNTLSGTSGHNNYSAFRTDCETFWKAATQ